MWIVTARLCERFHCLPNAGGLFDQDPQIVNKLAAVSSVLDEVDERESKKNE